MTDELLRRAADLDRQCTRRACVTATGFLSPAEQYALRDWARQAENRLLFHGGYPGAERQAGFFLPDWQDADAFDVSEHLRAIECVARFGAPGHRDWLGALLGLGLARDRLGDILVEGERAWVLCVSALEPFLLLNLEKVGRWGVKARPIPLSDLPEPKRETRTERFTVSSPRLDAVCAGVFRLSRARAAEAIAEGLVRCNYVPCLKTDCPVAAGDILSLRGRGKAAIADIDERQTRKGRVFVTAEIYIK